MPQEVIAGLLLGAVLATVALGSVAAAQSRGDAARGQEVFAAKACSRCHHPRGQPSTGPPLDDLRRPQGAYEFTGRLWNHAPAMFTVLKIEGLEWPRISPAEMADLMTYLMADPGRDTRPDLFKGRAVLVSKSCLKCHRLRGEGGRVGPDLAERRAVYTPAATWGATMWAHTPRMAAAAIQQGILYPRFSGDEMVHLLGFLQRADAQ